MFVNHFGKYISEIDGILLIIMDLFEKLDNSKDKCINYCFSMIQKLVNEKCTNRLYI